MTKQYNLEDFQNLAENLTESESYKFFYEFIKPNSTYIRNLFNTFHAFPPLQAVKATIPNDITFLDIVIYAYFVPRALYPTDLECYQYYLLKKSERKDYYSRIKILDNNEVKVASCNVNEYIEKNWIILRNSYKRKEEAVEDLLDRISVWKKISGDGELHLTEHPLIPAMTTSNVLKLFLLDVGCDVYFYIQNSQPVENVNLAVPGSLLLQQFIAFSSSDIPAEYTYTDESTVQIYNKNYNTIFAIMTDNTEGLSPEEQEKKRNEFLNALGGEPKSYPNITTKDFSYLVKIYNAFTPEDCKTGKKATTLGELAKHTSEDDATHNNKRREYLDLLQSIHKWSTYSFNITNGNRKRIMTFMSTEIGSNKDTDNVNKRTNDMVTPTDIQSLTLPTYEIGYHFDENEYSALPFDELSNMPLTIYLNSILLEDREKYITQTFFSNIYRKIKNPTTQAVFTFIYEKKVDNTSLTALVFTTKDLKKSFAAFDMRPARLAVIVQDSLYELQRLNALSAFSYDAKLKAFTVTFAEDY